MGKTKKLLIRLGGSLVILTILLVVSALLVPMLLNLKSVKERISADIQARIGSRVEFNEISISILPRPRVLLEGGKIIQPGKVLGEVESLVVCLRFFPLLMGKFKIGKLELNGPKLTVDIPPTPPLGESAEPFTLVDIERKIASLLTGVQSTAEDSKIVVKEGNVSLVAERREIFSFQNLNTRVSVSSNGIGCVLSSNSNLWEGLSLDLKFKPRHLVGEGKITVVRFHPNLLTDYFFASARQRLGESHVNLELRFAANGPKVFEMNFKGSIPSLTILKDEEVLLVKGKAVEGSFAFNSGETRLVFSRLDFESPRFVATGQFSLNPGVPRVGVELHGENVDAGSVRKVALALFGRYRGVRNTFRVVKGGDVPTITVTASGSSLSDLDKLKNYIIEGDMVNGIIFIPKVQLEVENARGHAVISQTVLEGTNLEGTTVGDSTARDGTLKLGLKRGKGGRAPFELNIDLDADLAELPPVLERVVKDEGFLRELALFKDVRGRAHGRLILGDNLKDVKPKVEIKEFNLHCHYERIPYAVEIAGGPFLYENTMVSGESLGGKLGSSTFNNVAALIDWGSESRIEVSSSAALELTLDELHPWLASYGKVKKTLRSIESLKGVIEMSSLHLNGELYNPNDWKLHIQGAVHDLLVRSEDLPGPLSLKEGSFEADQDDLKVSDWQSSLLDASVTVTGKIEGYLDEIHKVDLAFRGAVGSKANQWASDLFHLPSEIKLRSPLSLTKARLEWQKSGRIDFSGDLTVKEGPRVIVDVIKTPSEVSVSNLLIKDDMSDVSLVFDLKNRQFDLSFVGKLSSASVDSLLQTNEFIHGQITGDFRAHILIDQPMESTANGQLQMAGFNYACYGLGSLSIEKAKVEAAGNKLKIESASLDCVGNRFELNGSVEFSEAGFLLDMDLIASGLDWEDLRKFIEYKKEAVVRDRAFWNLPLRGAIRVNAGYFSYASHVWKPLKATISFTPEGEDVHITEAALCGISTPADVKVRSDVLDLGVKPKAVNQDISAAVACLWNKEKEGLIIGSFDLGGEVTVNQDMKAPLTDGLAKSLHGELDFSARNGRIYRWTVLSKIFSLINVTEIYRGKLPDLVNEGFAFDSIKGEGQFSEGKFIVHECIVDGPSMKMVWNGNLNFVDKTMDFTVLVAPLRTVDRIIEYIPFVGYVLGGTLISIPVKVSGDMDDPTVFPLSPSAVGSELLGYMQRVFNLPLKVIQPLMKQGTDHEEK